MPKSATPPSKPVVAVKPAAALAPLQLRPDGAVALTGGWRLGEGPKVKAGGDTVSRAGFDVSGWWTATVPGTVLATLVNQGGYPDPYYFSRVFKKVEKISPRQYRNR